MTKALKCGLLTWVGLRLVVFLGVTFLGGVVGVISRVVTCVCKPNPCISSDLLPMCRRGLGHGSRLGCPVLHLGESSWKSRKMNADADAKFNLGGFSF